MITLLTTPEHNIPYLFAAYAITWAFFFLYVFFTSRRQIELKREIESIQKTLESRDVKQEVDVAE